MQRVKHSPRRDPKDSWPALCAETEAEWAKRLRVAKIPEDSIKEVCNLISTRIQDAWPNVSAAEKLVSQLGWEIVTSYVKDLPVSQMTFRFSLYFERISTARLTLREQEVGFYIVCGLGNKEIAAEIARTVDTVKKHVQSLRRKLDIRAVGGDDRVNTTLNLLGL